MLGNPVFWIVVVAALVAVGIVAWWADRRWGLRMTKFKLKTGPAEAEFEPMAKTKGQEAPAKEPAGVDLGSGSDFRQAKIKGVAGRDKIKGTGKERQGGKTPGVRFGDRQDYRGAEIEDVAGRDDIEEA